ncbi:Alpha/Beta hydrolase protein [Choanephora cucurbitarum]|nr:Alpha/Beta hydrolase protein [Choanephora cucurbitarum]
MIMSTDLLGIPVFIDEKRNCFISLSEAFQHAEEDQEGVPEPGRSRPWPYWSYMINSFKNLFLTFYFNWTVIFTAPISSMAILLVFPSTMIFLILFEVCLKVFMDKLGGSKIVRYVSLKYGQGFSAINWGAPEMLLSDTSAKLVMSTLPFLSKPAKVVDVSGCRQRTFDLSIAQAFVLLSSLIYERDDEKVKEAYNLCHLLKKEDASSTNNSHIKYKIQSEMKEHLWKSEARIRQMAQNWGLHFAGVSELKSLGGPFCGIFWSEEHSFIVVAFKGTTPNNYEEFLVDATFQRTDARSFLFGCVHEGFYESLFSTTGFGHQDIRDPYGAIVSAVQTKAAQLQEKLGTNEPIQLWITGHSLGAALSSLLFARWLKCPEDLSHRLVMRDCYIIGTPAVGDSDFASTFSSHTNLPITRSSTLWRIINKNDIFTRLPPGYDSKSCGHFMNDNDFFNYSHIGHAIQITHSWQTKPLRSYPSSYQPPMQVNVVTHQHEHMQTLVAQQHKQPALPDLPKWVTFLLGKPWLQQWLPDENPIQIVERLYPFFLKDHIPSQYFHGLERARIYYKKEQEILHQRQLEREVCSLSFEK